MIESLQDRYAPNTRCFGCGPANSQGLRIKTFIEDDVGICEFQPQTHHQSFQGAVAGGIIGTLMDCHLNWTAAYHLMTTNDLDFPPSTVTSQFTVKFFAPTPSKGPLTIRARVVESSDKRATVHGELEADGTVTATCTAVFVVVHEGHPAHNRWR